MTQMSSSGRFVPKEYEVDYEQEPCYAHYGLKHGTLTRYSDDLENESYRTAIQVRIKTIDFVRKYADELKIRMSGLEFSVWSINGLRYRNIVKRIRISLYPIYVRGW